MIILIRRILASHIPIFYSYLISFYKLLQQNLYINLFDFLLNDFFGENLKLNFQIVFYSLHNYLNRLGNHKLINLYKIKLIYALLCVLI